MINSLWVNIPELNEQLEQVQEIILQQIKPLKEPLSGLIRQQVTSGGKMIRPACLLLFNQFGSYNNLTQKLHAAAAMEVLHLATLIHDDVIDGSNLRRNVPTIQVRLGDRNAIYAGDYLLTVYFELISKVANNLNDVVFNALSIKKILQGELDQLQINHNLQASVKMYLREISGKTAQLIELSAQLGAILAQADKHIVRKARFIGHNLGMAFQIQDDVLDYLGSTKMGKPQSEDLKNGIYTLPLIYALNSSQEVKRFLELHPRLNNEQVQQVVQMVIAAGGVQQAQNLAYKYSSKALALIKQLPAIPARSYLQELTQRLLKRQQ